MKSIIYKSGIQIVCVRCWLENWPLEYVISNVTLKVLYRKEGCVQKPFLQSIIYHVSSVSNVFLSDWTCSKGEGIYLCFVKKVV